MQLRTFLRKLAEQPDHFSQLVSLAIVQAKESSNLFARLVAHVARSLDCTIIRCNAEKGGADALEAQLSTSFLGGKSVVVIDSVSSVDFDSILTSSFIQHYAGPHIIMYRTSAAAQATSKGLNCVQVTVPENIGIPEMPDFAYLFNTSAKSLQGVVRAMKLARPVLTLEQLCVLDQYTRCLPLGVPHEELSQLCGHIFAQGTLFQLSDAFFRRDCNRFYMKWNRTKRRFPLQFWTSYFSEQLWAAYRYVYCQKMGQNKDVNAARKLPFSFSRGNGWRTWNLKQLATAHAAVTEIDALSKVGGGHDMLESVLQLLAIGSNPSSALQSKIQSDRY